MRLDGHIWKMKHRRQFFCGKQEIGTIHISLAIAIIDLSLAETRNTFLEKSIGIGSIQDLQPATKVVIVAHPDDDVLGVGGMIIKEVREKVR